MTDPSLRAEKYYEMKGKGKEIKGRGRRKISYRFLENVLKFYDFFPKSQLIFPIYDQNDS